MPGSAASGVMGIIGSVIGDISGSIAARERGRAIRQQGAEAEVQAQIEELNGKITENDLRDQLMRTLASNNAAAAASGVSLSSPSHAAATQDDVDSAGRAIRLRSLESLFKVGALRRQSRELFAQGKSAIITGKLNASATALGGSAGGYEGGGGGGSLDSKYNVRGLDKSQAEWRAGTGN